MNHADTIASFHKIENTKSRILSAANYCIRHYGASKTTIGDIAKASGLTRPTIYNHFKNKDEIIFEIGVMLIKETNTLVLNTVASIEDPIEKIIEALLISILSISENKDSMGLYQDESLVGMLRLTDHSSEHTISIYKERWGDIITEAQNKGFIRKDISTLDILIWLYFIECAVVMRLREMPTPAEDIRTYLNRFVLEGLIARP